MPTVATSRSIANSKLADLENIVIPGRSRAVRVETTVEAPQSFHLFQQIIKTSRAGCSRLEYLLCMNESSSSQPRVLLYLRRPCENYKEWRPIRLSDDRQDCAFCRTPSLDRAVS